MEEKEQLRRQIRLLQGLIDDYKTLHGSAPAPGTSASHWQPSVYQSSSSFRARYPGQNRRGFTTHHRPAWRKKYSLVNQPQGPMDLPGGQAKQPALGSHPQGCVLERQVQLSPDQNMVIRIKPPTKPGLASTMGAQCSAVEKPEATSWNDQRPQEGEGEPPGGRLQPSKPARVRDRCSAVDPLLICQKEPGKPRVVRSVNSMSGSPSEPRRAVSEGAIAIKTRIPPTPPTPPECTGVPSSRKVGLHSSASCVTQLLGARRMEASRPEQPDLVGLAEGLARVTAGLRPAREASLPVCCRSNKFRKNNYKWVASSAKSPRATRRAVSPRAAAENSGRDPSMAERAGKPQLKTGLDAKPKKAAPLPKPGASPSKYKWKASSSSSSSSSFQWQPEASPRDCTALLSPVLSQLPPEDRLRAGPSGSKAPLGETTPSGYKVKSRTKIIRRRGSASLPGDKKTTLLATTAKSHFNLRRRQAPRGKGIPVLKKTPNKGLLQVTRHRLCRLPLGRTQLPTKDASGLLTLRTPPSSKVIKTRYRIFKKNPASPLLGALPFQLAPPTWRTRRLPLPRSVVLSRLRSVAAGAEKAPLGSPRWRDKGYRCIGGVLYRVSANKLSKTSGRPAALRTGRLDPVSSCSRSLASRAVQRSLAIIRQAQQRRKDRRPEYCTYYNRFGRCNRGDSCPYIHDPEKVAVCTRFLRGTCKKTDGACPFSHHVSKDKMPVCSYFLKGVCSNSSCPYSHVYVSRKAEVCGDFLKGYCPLGAKCKKKHTLLCPDFSRRGVCPRGAQCQLLHRNQKHSSRRASTAPTSSDTNPRSRACTSHAPRKSSAAQRPSRPMPGSTVSTAAVTAPPDSPPVGLASPSQELPSTSPSCSPASLDPEAASVRDPESAVRDSKPPPFIPLHCSPSPAHQRSAHRSLPSQDSGSQPHAARRAPKSPAAWMPGLLDQCAGLSRWPHAPSLPQVVVPPPQNQTRATTDCAPTLALLSLGQAHGLQCCSPGLHSPDHQHQHLAIWPGQALADMATPWSPAPPALRPATSDSHARRCLQLSRPDLCTCLKAALSKTAEPRALVPIAARCHQAGASELRWPGGEPRGGAEGHPRRSFRGEILLLGLLDRPVADWNRRPRRVRHLGRPHGPCSPDGGQQRARHPSRRGRVSIGPEARAPTGKAGLDARLDKGARGSAHRSREAGPGRRASSRAEGPPGRAERAGPEEVGGASPGLHRGQAEPPAP
ncbi:zinc finger CCCH domain-containing protein 3 [Rhynchocyon petersi]